ncbi:MAG: hypothetical protein KA314_04455 [Chloroflexi bacterium]|nr:hypothetical protein [Chloroflexota bacterium]
MAILNLQVATVNDDGYMRSIPDDSGRNVTNSGPMVIGGSASLIVGSFASNNERSAAARFTGADAIRGTTINSAILQVKIESEMPGAVYKYYVSGQAADNPAPLTTTSGDLNITNRPRTSTYTLWEPSEVVQDAWYDIDITGGIQELADRAGFGGAIVVILDTHADMTVGEWVSLYSYNIWPPDAPKLEIDYSDGGGVLNAPGKMSPNRGIW